MYMLVCQSCNSADIEKFDNKNMFWCHSCGEELNKSELKIITFDVNDNTKCIDLNSKNIKKMKNRLETVYCPNEFEIYVGCKKPCKQSDMKKCWKKAFEKYELLVSEEPIYKFYCCGLHFAFKKKVK